MSAIHNERIKLTASYLNGLSIALFAIGSLAPLLSYAYATAPVQPLWLVALVSAICLAGSLALHLWARRTLGGLRDE